jgi:hypothetical protein
VTWGKEMSEILSMSKGDEDLSVIENSVDQKPQERKLVDQDSSKSTVATSDDGKSQPEDTMENLYILRFTRCPREFREALLEGPLLQDCQDSMKSVGLEAEMPTGSKIFCKPGLHKNAMEAVRRTFPNLEDMLRPYHVIVTEEFRPLVLQIVNGLPRGFKVKCALKETVQQGVKTAKAMGFEEDAQTELMVEVEALPAKRMTLFETIAASTVLIFACAGIFAAMIYEPKKKVEEKK